MSASSDFVAYCAELLSSGGAVRSNRMFGAYGLYVDALFVAIVSGQRLYLKVDDTTRPQFEAAGGECFRYLRQGQMQPTGFWTVPPEAMDSPALMLPWIRLAREAALRARAPRLKRRSAAG